VARATSRFVCQTCGEAFLRWEGQCRVCGAWNSLVETVVREPAKGSARTLTTSRGLGAFVSGIRQGPEDETHHRARRMVQPVVEARQEEAERAAAREERQRRELRLGYRPHRTVVREEQLRLGHVEIVVARIERDGVYAIGAAAGGQARHPSWFHNLVAHPTVQLQDGPRRRLMTARVAEGAERESWLAYTDELYPFFAGLRAQAVEAGDREVPLILLEPAES